MRVKSDDEGRDSEWSNTTRLSITLNQDASSIQERPLVLTYLLYACNVPCDVLDRDWVLHRKAMVLAFYSRFINQDPPIRRQSC
jgi:hypothetical protein